MTLDQIKEMPIYQEEVNFFPPNLRNLVIKQSQSENITPELLNNIMHNLNYSNVQKLGLYFFTLP